MSNGLGRRGEGREEGATSAEGGREGGNFVLSQFALWCNEGNGDTAMTKCERGIRNKYV